MKKYFLFVAVLMLAAVIVPAQKSGGTGRATARDAASQPALEFEGFLIEPNADFIIEPVFIRKIKKAILLLKEKSPDEFGLMQSVIGRIRATGASGANYNEEVMTIDIAKRTFDASLEWLASVLVHETQHIKKYRDTGKKYGDAHLIADKKKALQIMIDEELECNKIQLLVLEKIGASQFEIDYLKAQKGDHFDIDKDGDYDWEDYKLRDWE